MNYRPQEQGVELSEVPAFRVAEKLSLVVNEFALGAYSRREKVSALDLLHRKTVMITAHIAAGHSFGYGEDLERNISLCRQARTCSRECEQAVTRLADHYGDYEVMARIGEMLSELRISLEKRVRELEAIYAGRE